MTLPSPAAELARGPRVRMRPALGTFVRIAVRGGDDGAFAQAFALIDRLAHILSFHRSDSALHRLHRRPLGSPSDVDADLWQVLALARDLFDASRGAFDPSCAPALVRAGLLPQPVGVGAPDPGATLADLELPAPGRAILRRRLWLDLGGIAKGYIVDRVLDGLRRTGVATASVNAGGDLACFGAPETVALRDPRAPTRLHGCVELRDAALATSGGYFRHGALRGPRGARRRLPASVTVRAPGCATADGLTKVVAFAPRATARSVLERYGAAALTVG